MTPLLFFALTGDLSPVIYLPSQNRDFSPIIFRPHGEVNPIMTLGVPFDEELIEIPLGAIGNIQQDVGIAQGLLYPDASNIYSATC